MYRVYLVDDEALVLESMVKSIPWAEHDLEVAGMSTDPLAAREEILALRPEVVFTDIKMPGMTGLELIGSVREAGLESEFVVVSAHESFDYARQVIQHGGFDYLIKPTEGEQMAELLARLLARLEKKLPHRNLPTTSSGELNRIILHLNRSIDQKHTLGEIAAIFNISSGYICNLFSKHLGITFSAYLTKIRMEAAARALAATDKPVKQIAAECGYEDYFYFCRVFREFHGRTPTQMRSEK